MTLNGKKLPVSDPVGGMGTCGWNGDLDVGGGLVGGMGTWRGSDEVHRWTLE